MLDPRSLERRTEMTTAKKTPEEPDEELAIQGEVVKLNKRQKVARHFHNNQKVYIVGASCLVAGAALGALYVLKSGRLVNAKQVQVLAYKSTQELTVWIEALGDPGNVIQDTVSGVIYPSQGEAARQLGINPSAISKHLSGAIPNASGYIFKKLGKASVA